MKLSIIIPRYKETVSDMIPLISSIRGQVGIDLNDVEIIISNDNPEDRSDADIFSMFGLNISVLNCHQNGGPGIARQRGIDAAKGKYVMFCDADDSLHNVGVISAFYQELEKYPDCDYMSSKWLEELKVDGGYQYLTHELENTWMHGKMFRRELLNEVKFHEDLRVHEDSYFLSIIADAAKNRRQLNAITYVWRWNEGSITRSNNQEYEFRDFPEFIRAIFLANSELKKRSSKMLEYHVVQNLVYCYFVLMQDKWLAQPEYRAKSIDALKTGMKPFWDIYLNAPRVFVYGIYNEERAKNYSREIEKYTFSFFVELLMQG